MIDVAFRVRERGRDEELGITDERYRRRDDVCVRKGQG